MAMQRAALRAALVAAMLLGCACTRSADIWDIAAPQPARVLQADYFGTHFHRLGYAERSFPATPWPADLVGALRLWDATTRWADIEPAPGRYQFERLDAYVAQAQARGVPVMMVLGSPARWASARPDEPGPYGPGSAAEPLRLDDWDRYVSQLARRYKGRITQYELWNEPYFSDIPGDRGHPSAFFTGSVASMVELARRARLVLQREDPQAMLLSPGFVGATNRLDLFLANGGRQHVDAVAYHFYADSDQGFIKLYREVRTVMQRHGLGQRALYNTESGFALQGAEGQPVPEGGSVIDRHLAAALLARAMILGAFLGVERFYQYAWDNGRMGMLQPDGRTPTESLQAYASVRRWLLGASLSSCHGRAPHTMVCEAERDGAPLLIAWSTAMGRAAELRLPGLPVRIEQAGLGAWTRDARVPDSLVLPADGMPVAIWLRARSP